MRVTDKNIKVSVIIPVYNTAMYLEKCIQSLINQTLKEIEFIFVDDGSKDNSVEILKNYAQKDDRIVVLTQKHKRQGAARNLGMRVAKGQYIGLVDSDDWVEPDMFEKLYTRAKETESDLVMCPVLIYDEKTKEETNTRKYANLDCFSEYFFQNSFSPNETFEFLFYINLYACNKLFRTDYLKQNNLEFPENIYYEDSIFFFDYWFCASKISLIKDFCYHYRINSLTSTCTADDYNKLDIIKTLKYKKRLLKKYGVYEDLKYDFRDYNIKSFKYWYSQIRNKTAKILYLWMVLTNEPTYVFPFLKLPNEYFYEVWLLLKLCFLKDKKVVFWGASLFLESFLTKYRIKNSNILGIIDRSMNKKGSFISQYECFTPESLSELNPDEIIVTVVNNTLQCKESVTEFLKSEHLSGTDISCFVKNSEWVTLGRRNFERNLKIIEKSYREKGKNLCLGMKNLLLLKEKISYMLSGKLNIPQIEFVLTTKCTLRCKDCINYIPLIKPEEHSLISLNDFKLQLDNLLRATNKIRKLILIGGETFLVKDLDKYLAYACNQKQVDKVEIFSNGTLLPDENLLKVCKKYKNKVEIYLSNYSANKVLRNRLKYDEIMLRLKQDNIKYYFDKALNWEYVSPLPKVKFRDFASAYFAECTNPCVSVFGGKIFVCPRAGVFAIKGLYKPEVFDYIDLNIENNPKILKRKLVNFYSNLRFTACKYCSVHEDKKKLHVIPAIQLNSESDL